MPALEHNACSSRLFFWNWAVQRGWWLCRQLWFCEVKWVEQLCMHVSHISRVWLFVTLSTVAHQPLSLWASPSKNTAMGCHALLQGIFQTQGLNLCLPSLLHCRFFSAEPSGKPQNNCTQGKRNLETWPEKWKLRCYKLESSSSWVQRRWQLLSEMLFFTRNTLSSFKFLSVCFFWTSTEQSASTSHPLGKSEFPGTVQLGLEPMTTVNGRMLSHCSPHFLGLISSALSKWRQAGAGAARSWVLLTSFCFGYDTTSTRASLVAQRLKCLPARQETGFNPWVRKIPWRRKWQPTPVFLPRESHGQRSLVGHSPRGLKGSDTTERLHFHLHRVK